MLLLTLAVFALAAGLGLFVASQLIKRVPTTKPVAIIHGLVGATGLVLLIAQVARSPHHLLTWAIGLLVVAAIGGAVLFANDLRKKPGPVALIVIHAGVAVTAVLLVLIVALG